MRTDNTFTIDKITANDLSLEDVITRFNYCYTTAGEDYLKFRFTHPFIRECNEFKDYISISDELNLNNDFADEFSDYLKYIGKLTKYSYIDTLQEIKDSKNESNIWHYIIDIVIIVAFLLIFVYPGPGVVLFLGAVAYSVSDYFKRKNIISAKLYVFTYLIKMLKRKLSINALDADSVLYSKLNRINEIKILFKPFMAGTFLISESARTNSNPVGIIFDYLRMIFHVDIIKYNSMIEFIKNNTDSAIEIFDIVGALDCAISINKVKSDFIQDDNKAICKAVLGKTDIYHSIDMYHPLVNKPVLNSVTCNKNVLITGCNASGKSTFLKCIALNSLFAQCFGFAFASGFNAPYYYIYTSMALKDDISAKESYFIAEIKSLKRIVDASKKDRENDIKILCVIDEVLRGTNTIERIAASTEILKELASDNILCFVATHDIELTELLADEYENYHFSEDITDDDVKFSYLLKNGPATSRNAIKLLSLLGYDDHIVKSAEDRADDFMKTGKWVEYN